MNSKDVSTTVLKALHVIETLANAKGPLKASTLSELTDIPRSTIYRFLRTLMEAGYVDDLENGTYQLNTSILKVGRGVLDQLEIYKVAKPVLRELRRKTGETSLLAIREDLNIFHLGKYETKHSVRTHYRMGTMGHMHSTALGKAILAYSNEREQLLQKIELEPLTPNTITTKKQLREELEIVRDQGYALDDQENEEDIRSVAAPIIDHMDEVVAALGVSGPAYRLERTYLHEIAPEVVEAALSVSRLLGSTE